MLPETLEQWSVEVLSALLDAGATEDARLEFKAELPGRGGSKRERLRLPKLCTAMANSDGGFIVFGVAESNALGAGRLVGLEPDTEFYHHFGAKLSRWLEPAISWRPKNPPLQLATGRMVYIVEVEASSVGPIAVRDENGDLGFLKRTARGNEPMTWRELNNSFRDWDSIQARVALFYNELEIIHAMAKDLQMGRPTLQMNFDLTVIEGVLPYIAPHLPAEVLLTLGSLRVFIRSANHQSRVTGMKRRLYEKTVGAHAPGVEQWSKEIMDVLDVHFPDLRKLAPTAEAMRQRGDFKPRA